MMEEIQSRAAAKAGPAKKPLSAAQIRKKTITRRARLMALIQLIFFVSMPGAFVAGFSGVKHIFQWIGKGEVLETDSFVMALLALCACTAPTVSNIVIPPPPPDDGSGGGSGDSGDFSDPGGSGTDTDEGVHCKDIGQTPIILAYFTEYTEVLPEVSLLTHINYAHGRFANPSTGDGGIVITESKKAPIKDVVALKSVNPKLKVCLMVGGWGGHADGFSECALLPAVREQDYRGQYLLYVLRIQIVLVFFRAGFSVLSSSRVLFPDAVFFQRIRAMERVEHDTGLQQREPRSGNTDGCRRVLYGALRHAKSQRTALPRFPRLQHLREL